MWTQMQLPLRWDDPQPPDPYLVDVLLPVLRELQRRQTYVRTVALSAHAGLPERTARHYLRKLEDAGLVARRGMRGGWRAALAEPGRRW